MRRWALPGDPHGIAVGADGTVYVGLAQPQAVVAIDPNRGTIEKRVVLDSADIAATKELVSMRTNADRTRLYIANGSDESATILALPGLRIVREITIEGEPIRDALPAGRYLYLLGHRVHVYDANGQEELRTIEIDEPSAIAATSSQLAVIAKDRVTMFNTNDFSQTNSFAAPKGIEAALFAGRSLVLVGRDVLYRVGQSISSEPICLPSGSGPQIATVGTGGIVFLAERRCNSSAVTSAASLYGVNAYALAFDKDLLFTTERAGYLTIYRVPRLALAH